MAKGDSYTVVCRGVENPIIVSADKAGRKLVIDDGKEAGVQWIFVKEMTWTDKVVKVTRFAASDVVAIVADLKEADA